MADLITPGTDTDQPDIFRSLEVSGEDGQFVPASDPPPPPQGTDEPATGDEPASDEPDHTPDPQEEQRKKAAEDRARDEQGRFAKADKKKSFQDRFDEVTWQREEAKRERDRIKAAHDELVRRLEAYEARQQPERRPQPQPDLPRVADPSDPEPDPSDTTKYPNGEYDAGYLRDAARWAARDEHRQLQARAQRETAMARHAQALEQTFAGYRQRIDEAIKAEPQFLESLAPEVASLIPISALPPGSQPGPRNALAEQVLRSPHTALLLRHLSAHPDTLRRFDALHPAEFPSAFADLVADARLATAPGAGTVAAPPVSQAKPPVRPVTGTATVGADEGREDEPLAAYIARENARDPRRRR